MHRLGSRARILLTGHTGFVGQALRRWHPGSRWASRVEWITPEAGFDLRDAAQVRSLVERSRPDHVLHLAAQSFVPASFRDPAATLDVNLGGTLHLLQALSASGFAGRLLFVSSADIYGAVAPEDLPISELRLPAPRNPYAVSKYAAELLCRQWHFSEGLDVVIARPFNHTGAGQEPRFVLSGFAQRIARVKAGLEAPRMEVGNLDVTRDFSDVRDVLDAYLVLLDQGVAGEVYNVCSGIERRLADLLDACCRQAGVQLEVVVDPSRVRPNEQRRVVGSLHKLRSQTGWQPHYPIEETLAGLLAWWQAKETSS